jgi:tRNA-specific 2-thiouridylase
MVTAKVAVAMSGGTDSAVAALRLKEAGYEVIGFHLKLWPDPDCAATFEVLDKTCRTIGIPLQVLDLQDDFQAEVIADFCREYRAGRTPSPCHRCNQLFKFGHLLSRIGDWGCQRLATGHYARIEPSPGGYRLLRAFDRAKDQTYFLCLLTQTELSRLIFPLGEMRKSRVRELAEAIGLNLAKIRESHDICFVPGGDYRALLNNGQPPAPGDIVDTAGKLRGRHQGLVNYTIGQRQGLGGGALARQYVVRIDVAANRLVIGDRGQLMHRRLIAAHVSWTLGQPPSSSQGITAGIRYQSPDAPVDIKASDSKFEIVFREPQYAISPGQTIAFYRGDEVLGGGTIESIPDGETGYDD